MIELAVLIRPDFNNVNAVSKVTTCTLISSSSSTEPYTPPACVVSTRPQNKATRSVVPPGLTRQSYSGIKSLTTQPVSSTASRFTTSSSVSFISIMPATISSNHGPSAVAIAPIRNCSIKMTSSLSGSYGRIAAAWPRSNNSRTTGRLQSPLNNRYRKR